jgi:hypothetical protein
MIEKSNLEKSFVDSMNKNFERRSKFFQLQNYEQFTLLDSLVFEINKCLILEFYRASITLTNHFLERLLKIALIYDETEIGSVPIEKWDYVFNKSTEKYDVKSLANTIEQCKKCKLINESERDYLFNTIRELMRNGFSHADSSKVLIDISEQNTFFHGKLNSSQKINPIQMNQKKIPVFQSILMENFAKVKAEPYFDYIFELSRKIEKRLILKKKSGS